MTDGNEWTVRRIGTVASARTAPLDDDWGRVTATIALDPPYDERSVQGLDRFSHVEVVFLFDRVPPEGVHQHARRPRGNPAWPEVGIFAQRAKGRPNRLGSTIVQVVGREGRCLRVLGLDAVDGTPVLDIKPVMTEFLPREPVRQPDWSRELMRDYWRSEGERPCPQ